MCWSMRVFWTVFQNMFIRLGTEIVNVYYNGCCCCSSKTLPKDSVLSIEKLSEGNQNFEDYIVITDLDDCISVELPEIKPKSIEHKSYFRAVDRLTAEEILSHRVDGSCLVRPFREKHISIKYIVSIYAKSSYFHLYIRKTLHKHKFGIGLEKPFEKLFNTPSDIISYYRLNKLLCTNRKISVSLVLIPIS